MFDLDSQVEDVRDGVEHRHFGKGTVTAVRASILSVGIAVNRDPGLSASKRMVALSDRPTVEPAQLDPTPVALHEPPGVHVHDDLCLVPVLPRVAEPFKALAIRPEEHARVEQSRYASQRCLPGD